MYVQKTNNTNTKAEIMAELGEVVGLLHSSETEKTSLGSTINELRSDLAVFAEVKTEAKPITVVIPFNAGDNELDLIYLIRSIKTNLVNHQIAIVGTIPTAKLDVLMIDLEVKSSNEQINLVHAIQAACLSDLVSDKFIVAPLDTYFVSPVSIADIEILKTSLRQFNGVEEEQAKSNTIQLLERVDLNNVANYACKLPFVVEKLKFVELFTIFPEIESVPVFIETIYNALHNSKASALELDFQRDNIQLNVFSKEPSPSAFEKAIANKKFLSVWESAKGSFIDNYLNVKFENRCSIELE